MFAVCATSDSVVRSEDGCEMDDSTFVALPAPPGPFRSYSSTSPSPDILTADDSRQSSPIEPQLASDDDDDAGTENALRAEGGSNAASSASPAQSFRQLRVSESTVGGRSPHTSHFSSRFHPYTRQLPYITRPLSPPANTPTACHSPLPLPLSVSFTLEPLSINLPHPAAPVDSLSASPATPSLCWSTPPLPPLAPPPSPLASACPLPAASLVGYHSHRLPVVSSRESVVCISCDCVADLLSDVSGACARYGYSRIRIIDCRFQYEFDGGHIRGAEWLADRTDVDGLLASSVQHQQQQQQPLSSERDSAVGVPLLECVILHCEFSRHRAPSVYRSVRRRDRELNGIEHFPSLHLPELYVMQSGYSAFHSSHPQLCVPHHGAYVAMLDRRYQNELKRDWKHRKGSGAGCLSNKPLIAAAALTRATSASSALHQTTQRLQDGRMQPQDAKMLQSLSPTLPCAPHPVTPPLRISSPDSMSPVQLSPPLCPPSSEDIVARPHRRRTEVRLIRSASCAPLRQNLFNAHSSDTDSNVAHKHSDTRSGIEKNSAAQAQITRLSQAPIHPHPPLHPPPPSVVRDDSRHLMPVSDYPVSRQSADALNGAYTSPPSHSAICVQQLFAV